LPLHQLQQVLLVAQRLLLRLPCQLLVTGSERRQVQFLQIGQQQFLQLLRVQPHVLPPCFPVGRHTTPDPQQPQPLPSSTLDRNSCATLRPPPPRSMVAPDPATGSTLPRRRSRS